MTSRGSDISNLLLELIPRWSGRERRKDGLPVTRFIKESGPERSRQEACPVWPERCHCVATAAVRPPLLRPLCHSLFQQSLFLFRKLSAWRPLGPGWRRLRRPQVEKTCPTTLLVPPDSRCGVGSQPHSALRAAGDPVGQGPPLPSPNQGQGWNSFSGATDL